MGGQASESNLLLEATETPLGGPGRGGEEAEGGGG